MHYKLLLEFALLVFVSVYVVWVIACAITHEMDVPKWFTASAAVAAVLLYFI